MSSALIIVIILGVVAAVVALMALNAYVFGAWACRVFGWHHAPVKQSFDGCSLEGICPRCGKRVLQDSQGNWFEVAGGEQGVQDDKPGSGA